MIDQSLIFLVISWALAIAYLIFQGINRRWEALGSFVVIFAILYFLKVELKLNLLLSIVGATIVALPRANISSQNNEHFENAKDDNDKDNSETDTKKTMDNPDSDENDENDDNKDDEKDDEKFENPRVDAFSTFMETYKSLTPNQIENMTSDTKELIATQKSLLDTVKSLAPVVSQGKEMLDTFKDYFGPGETQNIMSMFSPKSGGDSKKKK